MWCSVHVVVVWCRDKLCARRTSKHVIRDKFFWTHISHVHYYVIHVIRDNDEINISKHHFVGFLLRIASISEVESVYLTEGHLSKEQILWDFGDLFSGLGCIPGQHHIELGYHDESTSPE